VIVAALLLLQAPAHAVVVATDAAGQCRPTFDGQPLPASSSDEAALARLGARGQQVSVEGDPNQPYRCIGWTIYRLQRAGYQVRTALLSPTGD
jgi:hypothetical protein